MTRSLRHLSWDTPLSFACALVLTFLVYVAPPLIRGTEMQPGIVLILAILFSQIAIGIMLRIWRSRQS